MRRSTTGAPGLLLAALFLVVRLLAASVAMAAATPDTIAVATLCQSGLVDDAPHAPAHDAACLICPACHLVGHASLPVPAAAALPIVSGGAIGEAATLPAKTGPPHRPRVSAHPTGPPTAST